MVRNYVKGIYLHHNTEYMTWKKQKDQVMTMMTTRCQDELALPKSPAPDRPFLIRYMAQERGPELENAPGFILQTWV